MQEERHGDAGVGTLEVKIVDCTSAVLPLLAVEISVLLLLILFPDLVLTMPNSAFGTGR
jgi:TRAP-type C4-dicarboxylate transport system permease large subunit